MLCATSHCLGESAAAATDPVRTAVHWHAHGVRTLAFTPDGSILLSGGDENVLVLWQIATLHKVRNDSL